MSMSVPNEMTGLRNQDPRPARAPADSPSEGPSPAATDGDAPLRDRHAAVRARIDAAARACGRRPEDVALLAVSKTFDADTVLALAATGQRAFGENYLQEALPKMAAIRDRWALPASGRSTGGSSWHTDPAAAGPSSHTDPAPAGPSSHSDTAPAGPSWHTDPAIAGPSWHFIGPIQSNKTKAIAEAFDWVHSVDREKVARRLSEQRPEDLAPLQVCVQVDVSGEATKSGCDPSEAVALGAAIAAMPKLRLRGVMAIPAPSDDQAVQRAQFARVRAVFEAMRAAGLPVDTLSMGMSGDLEAAIAEGATIVRVGTALFGARPGKAA
jgi:PLP dependent protein